VPSDRGTQHKRQQAIREILRGDQRVEQQKDLVALLRERGIRATQSSVSRDLRDLGAVRAKGYYEIPFWREREDSPFRKVVDFIRAVRTAGPYQTLLVTEPGAGGVVAQAIEEDGWEEDIVGTVAGPNSVLILTENFFYRNAVYERLKYYLGLEEEEEGEEEAAESAEAAEGE
jgi:transcriptional regulator of arginine metabolism